MAIAAAAASPNTFSLLKSLRSSSSLKTLTLTLIRFPSRSRPLPGVRSLFTGIVEEIGRIDRLGPSAAAAGGFELRIAARTVLGGVRLGDSIAVDGACLTVTDFNPAADNPNPSGDGDGDGEGGYFTVGLSPETLRRTSLGDLGVGSAVNLERALQPSSRMGGHIVQGHVDGTGEIAGFSSEGDSLWVRVRAPRDLLRLIVPKGFIAVDGTSLTVVGVDDDDGSFDFMLVAYTQQKVVIPTKKVGDKVNLEVDILGKYVEKLLRAGAST
ncbi:Riboflavin synthase [Ananas comosus]|uniref:Riboflavin synthase n=1 Tax=Ananas comosus TaxID=4615 RepID=A0A199W0J1_ANACO|nr:Riboflavin synthase [Ananas comosus]